MFLGEFEHTIDDKGRVAIPARFREELVEGLVLTKGFDRCLQAFPQHAWRPLAERVSKMSMGSAEARSLRRLLFAGAAEVEVDRQGRILIPQNLREYAGLSEQVVIAGMDSYFELWASERWQGELENLDKSAPTIAEYMAELGI